MPDPGVVLPFPGPDPDRDSGERAAQPAPREIELKLDVPEEAVEPLQRALAALGGETRRLVQHAAYYDTEGDALRRAGFSLRLREAGGVQVQTLKASDGGLFDRGEWEVLAPDGLDLTALADTPLRPLLAKAGPLRPQFTNRVERLQRTACVHGAVIEIVLDLGEVEGHGRRAPISQLELELKAGPPEALFRLARALGAATPLRLTFQSKAGLGYALASAEAPGAVKARAFVLQNDVTAGGAFAAVAADCLRQIVANEQVLRLHRRPEALHQMRVGLRRLRSAFSLFKPVAADDRYESLKAELRWMARQLDEARDVDVFIAETWRPAAEALGKAHGLAAFGKRLLQLRTRAYDRVGKTLKSARAIALPLDLAEWLETGAWRTAPALAAARDQDAGAFGADALRRLRRKVKRKGEGLEGLSAERRHELRIAGKKLRYGFEVFAARYRAKRSARFVKRLKALQEALGALNDVAVGRRTAVEMARGAQAADLGFAAGLVVGLKAVGERELLAAAARQHRALLRLKQPWKT